MKPAIGKIKEHLRKYKKVSIYYCSCGSAILIVPNASEIRAIAKNHIIEHERLTGQPITKEDLIQRIQATYNCHCFPDIGL